MSSIYFDSSVLIAFLYEEADQPERYRQSEKLISAIRAGQVSGVVSFYALPELYSHVERNQPIIEVNQVFRLSLVELFSIPLTVAPFLERDDLARLRQQITISDAEDVRHVAVALDQKCDAIVTFDRHFREIANLISVYTPAEFLATLESAND